MVLFFRYINYWNVIALSFLPLLFYYQLSRHKTIVIHKYHKKCLPPPLHMFDCKSSICLQSLRKTSQMEAQFSKMLNRIWKKVHIKIKIIYKNLEENPVKIHVQHLFQLFGLVLVQFNIIVTRNFQFGLVFQILFYQNGSIIIINNKD